MRTRYFAEMCLICAVAIVTWSLCHAEDKSTSGAEELSSKAVQDGRIFDMKIPQGFQPEPVDEAGILKWRKDSAEIYLVAGDLHAESGDTFISEMQTAAEKNKQVSEVNPLKLKVGKGLIYKEKPPEDPNRQSSWYLIAISRDKVITIDFSAPSKDFKSFVPAFEEAINSFKLKPSS